MLQKIKSKKFLLGMLVSVIAISSVYFATFDKKDSQAATFSWIQGGWSLGADLSAIATYTLNQTGWQKFYSASDNISYSTPNQITLTNPTVSVTHTSDNDFNGGTIEGNIKVSGGAVSLGCPDNYVFVPANATYGTNSFCVMKYEAKNVGGIATSQADGTPWVGITQTNAIAECAEAGGHLITNDEWMTIARNVEAQAANWANGTVGSLVSAAGGLKRGNVGVADSASYNGADPEYGATRDTKAQLVLSNGETIWDLSGNVWEWTNNTISCAGAICTSAEMPYDATPLSEWIEFTAINTYGQLSYDKIRPSNSLWNTNYGMGRLDTDADVANPSGNVHAFGRGGYWALNSLAGAFTLDLQYAPAYSAYNFGFRCVR